MTRWNGIHFNRAGKQFSIREVRRFLDTWFFDISHAGQLNVRPLIPAVSTNQVTDFLSRLDLLGIERLPHAMAFDFRETQMPFRRRRRISDTLHRYAEERNRRFVEFSGPCGHGSLVLLFSIPAEASRTETAASQNRALSSTVD